MLTEGERLAIAEHFRLTENWVGGDKHPSGMQFFAPPAFDADPVASAALTDALAKDEVIEQWYDDTELSPKDKRWRCRIPTNNLQAIFKGSTRMAALAEAAVAYVKEVTK